ncbi:alpha/beta hydrolase family protein [Massilia sp. CMS3.1]|uniref:alpha/beta hydrolase family protein n=1 Tax=Massilia sp. CMS3.1 TaxID=3373083 RepID=UPI003EE6A0F9
MTIQQVCTSRSAVPAPLARSAIAIALALGMASPGAPQAAQRTASPAPTLVSSSPHEAPAGINAAVTLLVHSMPGIAGTPTPASSLLFVPRGSAPAGGWPVVAWAHGTTTPGLKTCAPSLSPELDGGLTRDGFKSDYVYQIGTLVDAGYVVVAPDFEGLGPVATVAYPYYSASSLARSLIAGVRAAREAEPSLSHRMAVFGHSDGGHAVLSVESRMGEAPELQLVGTVASVPYTSIAETAASFGRQSRAAGSAGATHTARMMEQFQVALMATGLMAQSPDFDPSAVMGPDLVRTLSDFRAACSVKAIGLIDAAVKQKGKSFAGLKAGWETQPQMKAFLEANDPYATPGFTLRLPTLVLQGTADPFVLEPITSRFVAKLSATGAPVKYKRYPGADHFSILRRSNADVQRFLTRQFGQAPAPGERRRAGVKDAR